MVDRLFRRNRPYYIVPNGSPRASRKARLAHVLCHALNLAGEEAYLFGTDALAELRTPLLTPEIETRHRKARLSPVVVYCDPLTADNPLRASVAVYVREEPGPAPVEDALVFATSPDWLPPWAPRDQILFVPTVDPAIFNPGDAAPREGLLMCCDGFPDALEHFAPFLAHGTLVSETSFRALELFADKFRRAERFYAFGDTPLALEAALCGCPVIFVAPPSQPQPTGFFRHVRDGIAFGDGPDELDEVAESVARVPESYGQGIDGFGDALANFVGRTQAHTTVARGEEIFADDSETLAQRWSAMCLAPPRVPTERYARWRHNHHLREIDGQLLAERMVLKWSTRPLFHLLLELRPGEEALLADTLDSLARQLYEHWQVSVVCRHDTHVELPEELPKVEWIYVAAGENAAQSLERILRDSHAAWIALIEPGVRLEPHALVTVADYAALRPKWAFVYCDEDVVSPLGEVFDPRFKPDLNLDLLRSMNYLGAFCAVKRDAMDFAPSLALPEAENYDIALRVIDRHGPAAVGHVAEILAHAPAGSMRPLSPDDEKAALESHLVRNRMQARIQDGHGYATRRVIYEWAQQPLVSVILPTRDKSEYLAACLDTLFTRTRYPAVELIVVDNGSQDVETVALLDGLHTDSPWPVRVLRDDADFNYGALCNQGVAGAQGQYLLFLDNDAAILQDDWLDRLMATAQRPEVGITAPRVSYPGTGKLQDTGLILGLRGVASAAYDGVLDGEEPGYQGRATVDQNVSAVQGACMLVRRAVFEQVNGFQATDFPVEHATLDLCLRVGAAGYWIAWTPYVTVAHYGRVSRSAQDKAPEAIAARAAAAQRESETLLTRWLPQLANDPFYNRHLSLTVAYRPEDEATITWDANFHDRPRLIGFPVTGGSGEYRMIQPFHAIADGGLAQVCIVPPHRERSRVLSVVEMARAAADVVVVHQTMDDARLKALQAYKKYLPDTLRVIGLDDLVTLLPPKHPSFRKRLIDARSRLRTALSLCDRAVVSTAPLAELCADLIPEVRVMPNCLQWDVWGKVEPVRDPQSKPRVGWIGAQQHYGDLEHIFEVVVELADEVDWVFMGMCPRTIAPYVKEMHGWEHGFDAYSAKMASLNLDLAIAPLDVNPFNEAKSNLRLLEYGAMRWPVVCTDIYPYRDAPVTRVPNTTREWTSAIREKLSDRAAARAEGDVLRRWVEDNFILERRVTEWCDAFTRRAV